jgi:hypothetical protein
VLERVACVAHPKRHDLELVEAKRGDESGLGIIFLFESSLSVAALQVDGREPASLPYLVQ